MTRRIPDQRSIFDKDGRFRDMLRMRGLKATPGRIGLLRVLTAEPRPITSSEIKKKLETACPPEEILSRSAIFRTLESLIKSGLIHRINLGSPDSSYEIDFGRKHHHHIVCTSCGDIEDISYCPAKRSQTDLIDETKKFKAIYTHSLEFFGLCKKCA
jgi:Fe2+ or Zn2+ uptake regulation protein